MTTTTVTLVQVQQMAEQLQPADQARLLEYLARSIALSVFIRTLDHEDEEEPTLEALWQQFDADPAGWIGPRTATEELVRSRR
jgi:hypothetical protein